MNGPANGAPTVLIVGGCGGLVGRALLEEFGPDHNIVSLHRHRAPNEARPNVRWVRADVARVADWSASLAGVENVVVLAWHRSGSHRRFAALARALSRLVRDAEAAGVRGLVHLSVPEAPAALEDDLPYLYAKREVDRALLESRVPFALVRPTMLFGPRDKLSTVMLRTMHRYRRFPMFGDGSYHLSPLAVRDLAAIVRRELGRGAGRVVTAGGPRRWQYRELTDRMFSLLGLEPRYVALSPRASLRLARLLELVGARTLYRYEVEWLLSDRLGLAPYEGLDRPLRPIEPFLEAEVARLQGH